MARQKKPQASRAMTSRGKLFHRDCEECHMPLLIIARYHAFSCAKCEEWKGSLCALMGHDDKNCKAWHDRPFEPVFD
jgi:hypothetical protein